MDSKLNYERGIVPLSRFRQLSKSYLKAIRRTQETLVLTQNGRSAAVVLSPAAYQQLEYERELFKAIAEGEKDLALGKTVSHERLFAELLS